MTKIHPIIIGFVVFILSSVGTFIVLPFPYPYFFGLIVGIIVALIWRKQSKKGALSSSHVDDANDIAFCRKCGNKLDSTNNFCIKCGDKR